MRSEPSHTSTTAGMSLLEVMVAFALLSLLLVGILNASSTMNLLQAKSIKKYEITAFARATLDEYIVTYPSLPQTGSYKDTWEWIVTERAHIQTRANIPTQYFDLVEIEVSTKMIGETSNVSGTVSTVVARRR